MEQILKFLSQKEVYGVIIIAIIVFTLNKILNIIVDKFIQTRKNEVTKKRVKTVVTLFKNIKKYALISIGTLALLDLYGVNTSSILASLGVASAVIALSFQDTLKDIISGAAIIMDNYYMVGDIIKYGDFQGTVVELGLRTTKIKNPDGQIYVIANRNINEIINLSQKKSSPLITIPTAYEEDVEKVENVLNKVVETIKTWDGVDKENTAYIGILELADSSVNYGIRIYCSQENQFRYKWDALRLIKIEYDKAGIKIPYTQIEVHNGK